MDQNTMAQFGTLIQRLINREDLTRPEAYAAFSAILLDRQPELQQGALLAALTAKGETAGEIAGAWSAIDEHDTVHAAGPLPELMVENSGTGMDCLKTFNVSSAAAIVAAAGGAVLARHGARALSSRCGTVDILEAVGVGVDGSVAQAAASIRSVGIGLFNGMSAQVHPGGLGRILGRIRFGSTLNIAASLANPARPTHAVRGVHCAAQVPRVAAVLREIGYRRALVACGSADGHAGGMDELSVCGPTLVCEIDEHGEREHMLTPEACGVARHPYAAVAALDSPAADVGRFLAVLAGRGPAACRDFVCLNAGAVLHIAGRSATIGDGVARSRDLLASGAALAKLRDWVAVQNDDPAAGTACFDNALRNVKH
ncbi:MAG TPA: anthranilate phosphoribosyltransferase [bacterium]|nr:anthranilate phosphoribosyltransferase [bacterium]